MKKQLLILLCLLFHVIAFGQSKTIQLNYSKSDELISVKDRGYGGFEMTINVPRIILNDVNIENKKYISLSVDGFSKIFEAGVPGIPNYSKLIEIPIGASVKITAVSYDEEYVKLSDYGIEDKIIPAQPSCSKNQDIVDFYFNENIYNSDFYIEQPICRFEEIGMLRGNRLGRIIISPIQYNPVKNVLKILNNLQVSVVFENVNIKKTEAINNKYNSRVIDDIVRDYTLNSIPRSINNTKNSSPTFVIISDRMFEYIMTSYAGYKESTGFNVLLKYTDESEVGATTSSIKNYLESIYNNPPTGYGVPEYVMFVGDVAQIPTYYSNGHPTDLYYFDYTNDHIPDVYYGRYSANNSNQLDPQIAKTLIYESLLPIDDPSYMYNSVLVAGYDWQGNDVILGNRTLNYAENQYFNTAHDITAYTYYQREPSGANYLTNIKNKINSGAGLVYYTGHCDPSGWDNPNLTISSIPSLTNEEMYGLWIGNCCKSNKFDETECFGEAALRSSGKGAMGYIGATDYTYWVEDYYWALGNKDTSFVPSFDANHLGAFDRFFQMDTIDYIRQGQFIVAGNLAVEESNSTKKQYYWEIYHLMGDPSVKIEINCGTTTITNETITNYRNYRDCKIIIENTTIQNNAHATFESVLHTTINGPFEVKLGSTISIY